MLVALITTRRVSEGLVATRLPDCCFVALVQSGFFVERPIQAVENNVRATPSSDRFFGRKIWGREIDPEEIFLPIIFLP